MQPDMTPAVLEVTPLLMQLAREVPAMGPDVDKLNVELQSRMGGLPAGLAGLSNQGGLPTAGVQTPLGPSMAGAIPPGPPQMPGQMAGAAPAGPGAMPSPPPMGAMDIAMQLETKLPALANQDTTLMPYVQGFIARMREEVPKVVSGETEAINPPQQMAPTESMLSKIPVTF